MATETLYATSHITGNISNPDNALANTPTTWAGTVNANVSATSRYAIGDPVDPLTSGYTTHSIAVVARKGTNTGTPTASINLYENGSLVKSLVGTTNITSTTGQTLSSTFTTAEITNRANIEVQVVITGVGGNQSTRNSAQVSHFTMVVDTTVAATVVERTGSISATATLSGTGLRIVERTGSISGTSTLSGNSQKIRSRTGSISSEGILVGDGEKLVSFDTIERTGSISGVSSLSGDGLRRVDRTGSLVGESIITGDGSKLNELESLWGTANATLNNPTQTIERTGAISGTSILNGVGEKLILVPTLKHWNGTEWVPAVVKHGVGWPVVQMNNL